MPGGGGFAIFFHAGPQPLKERPRGLPPFFHSISGEGVEAMTRRRYADEMRAIDMSRLRRRPRRGVDALFAPQEQ